MPRFFEFDRAREGYLEPIMINEAHISSIRASRKDPDKTIIALIDSDIPIVVQCAYGEFKNKLDTTKME